ncbi:hypothetical protein [Amphibiibacter pelophylacis]|uniref:Uncharacterized protein n=1 Tax=Amphibiibacter pelophylacis TaxID=1799477 RepID=A0ACC6P1U2_9BURK
MRLTPREREALRQSAQTSFGPDVAVSHFGAVTALEKLRLEQAWQQCQRHLHHLNHALAAVQAMLPLTGAKLAALDDEAVQDWDQLILTRFTPLTQS